MRIADLLGMQSLGLRLLHGNDDRLAQPVRWACTTDLLDPSQYLSGGELVLSGLVWHRTPADSERFVSAVTAAGAAALFAGEALFDAIPDDLVEACRRHDLPLCAVATHVSFGQISDLITGAASAERSARLAASLSRQRELLSWLAQGKDLDELATKVGDDTGLTAHVLTATGRHVGTGRQPLQPGDIDRLTRTFLSATQLPALTEGPGRPYSLFAVGPGLGHRVTSWFVAAEGIWTNWDAEAAEAVSTFTSIAALHRAWRDNGSRGSNDAASNETAPASSVDTNLLAIVAGFPDRYDLGETAGAVLDEVTAEWTAAPAATVDGQVALVLVPAVAGAVDELRLRLGRLTPGMSAMRLAVGVGGPAPSSSQSGAIHQARHAYQLAAMRDARLSVVASDDVTSSVLLLAAVPDDVRRAFAHRVLQPVLAYDSAHDAGLLDTLRAFLDCSGSWSRTADALHLHVNTVRYRLARIEELTGRDLGALDNRVDALLALRSL